MKPSASFLLLALSAPAFAQSTSKPATSATHTAATHTATPAAAAAAKVPACSKLPELSSKIPALPAGLPCAKPLYTITVTPGARLDYVSPIESPDLATFLGLDVSSFSLDYIDISKGDGGLAAPLTFYTINYTGYLTDGTKFDSSYDKNEPITIGYGQHQVIPGWDTGLAGMHIGGKRRLFIPYQLAYGAQAHGPIPAKSMLIFDVELVSASNTPPPTKQPTAPPTPPQPGPAPTPAPAQAPKPAATPTPTPAPTPKP